MVQGSPTLKAKAALGQAVLILLGAAVSLSGQATTDWKDGIVKIETNAGAPGTGFVVAMGADHAFIVTAAHVVAGDSNPSIFFAIDEYNPFPGNVIGPEGADERGLALIRVSGNLPKELIALAPTESVLRTGDQVTVAGFPRVLGSSYTQIRPGVASVQGRDVILDRRVDDGYSGGPVLRGGKVGALAYGKRGDYGLAIPAVSINAYISSHRVQWGEGADRIEVGTVKVNPDDGLDYVWIPPGEFPMGCSPGDRECDDDEGEKPHTVKITKGFWLGQTEVTVRAYRRFDDNTQGIDMPGQPVIGDRKLNPGWSDQQQPIVAITWQEAKTYCEDWAKGRMPTEAEWDYAARAESKTARYGDLDDIAWYADNSGPRRLDSTKAWNFEAGKDGAKYRSILEENGNQIHRVRQKNPNAWRLYDMLGNVWEWVADWYKNDYYQTLSSPAVDPPGPTSGDYRVLRGGSCLVFPGGVRASNRGRSPPESRYDGSGFRCAREAIP